MDKQKNMKDLVIVGGGASGLMAAIQAAMTVEHNKQNLSILVLDKNEKPGKKILATGNGRCNLTNTEQELGYYMTTGSDKRMISDVLAQFTWKDTIAFFENAGMKTVDKGGYVYPRNLQAQTVAGKLISLCNRYGIEIRSQSGVEHIMYMEQKECRKQDAIALEQQQALADGQNHVSQYKIIMEDGTCLYSKAVIVAVGSQASIRGDYLGQALAKELGLKWVAQLPALCGLVADFQNVGATKQGKSFFKEVSGVRCEVRCKAMVGQACLAEEAGELQLTEYGISGIVIFCLSRYISRGIKSGRTAEVIVDFLPDLELEELTEYVQSNNSADSSLQECLSGILNQKLALGLTKILSGKYYKVQPDVKLGELDSKVLKSFLKALKEFPVGIKEPNGFDKAQVATGGVALKEMTSKLETHKYANLFLCGEVLDVDAICGGYNLQWAWASGAMAGRSAAGHLIKTGQKNK